MSSQISKDADARLRFNMKVLKRHDPTIVNIVESASYVTLYQHDGEEWTKAGVEGPMFLFKRHSNPPFGFFILNRNGVENFSAHITPQDDLELTPQFIIYQSAKDDQTIGLWVFEAEQRDRVGQEMLKLQNASLDVNGANVLFPASSTNQAVVDSSQNTQSLSLDALFGSSAGQNTQVHQHAPSSGKALLDSMFQSASTGAETPSASFQPPAQRNGDSQTQSVERDTDQLKALLGLSQPQSSHISSSNTESLDALFASAKLSPSNEPKQSTSNGTLHPSQTKTTAPADALNDTIQTRLPSCIAPLTRRDFVREVLSLIHTDPSFVDDLHQKYLARMQ